MVTMLVPPIILTDLTGVKYIRLNKTKTTLVYVDGSEESASVNTEGMDFLNIVSAIQGKRK